MLVEAKEITPIKTAVGVPSLDQIFQLEQLILKLPQVEMPTINEFLDGLYARSMFIPAGVCLTGAIHKNENFLFVRYGDITILTEDGVKRFKAGDMISSKAGIKRVGLTHADTLVTTIHANPTNETDEKKLWDLFTIPANSNLLESQLELLGV